MQWLFTGLAIAAVLLLAAAVVLWILGQQIWSKAILVAWIVALAGLAVTYVGGEQLYKQCVSDFHEENPPVEDLDGQLFYDDEGAAMECRSWKARV